MIKILTLATIAIFFAANFANAATVTTGNGGKANLNTTVKTTKSVKAHYSKISTKEFSIKAMQDTKDILIPMSAVDYSTHKS